MCKTLFAGIHAEEWRTGNGQRNQRKQGSHPGYNGNTPIIMVGKRERKELQRPEFSGIPLNRSSLSPILDHSETMLGITSALIQDDPDFSDSPALVLIHDGGGHYHQLLLPGDLDRHVWGMQQRDPC